VIAYARRGEGDSEAKELYDIATLTDDLRGLMDGLGIAKAHLVGFSMGGDEITALAGMHPERVDRLVYLDAAYDWADPATAALLQKVPPSLDSTDNDRASLDAFRKFEREVEFPSVADPTVFEAWMRDHLVINAYKGSVEFRESDNTIQALFHTLLTAHRDYAKVHSPALAIYATTLRDVTEHQRPKVRADVLAWEEKYVVSFRATSIERARQELSSVEIMKVPCTHRDMVFACKDTMVAAMRRFLSGSATQK
jgi:pimeloyl-ACP methyl ester carboxylesterase